MRGIQYTAATRSITGVSGILDHPLEPVVGLAEGETRWRMMTAGNGSTLPRREAPELCRNFRPIEGAGNAGCPLHP